MGSISNDSSSGHNFDVVVVGGGNAALCAALSAHDHGARVLVLEAAPREDRGGNSRFAGTVFRATHQGMEQVKKLLCEEAMADAELCGMLPYTEQDYSRDLAKLSHGRNDKTISDVMVKQGWETLEWMKSKGVKWELIVRKYMNTEGLREKHDKVNLEPGAPVMAVGGGVGDRQPLGCSGKAYVLRSYGGMVRERSA
jgi:tricarballylate dehydrogenase